MAGNQTSVKLIVSNLDRKTLPTCSVAFDRFGIFESTRRPQLEESRVVVTTSGENIHLGTVSVKGRLGQTHEDMIEIVNFNAQNFKVHNKRLHVIVDPYLVKKGMCQGKKQLTKPSKRTTTYSAQTIDKIQDDLMSAIIKFDKTNGRVNFKIKTHIVDKIYTAETMEEGGDPDMAARLRVQCSSKFGQERSLQLWIFSEEWTEMLGRDIALNYDPTPLRQIVSGSVVAMARYVLTHKSEPNGGWKEDSLIRLANVYRREDKVRQEVVESFDELLDVGIRVDIEGRWHLLEKTNVKTNVYSFVSAKANSAFLAMSAKANNASTKANSASAIANKLSVIANNFKVSSGSSDTSGI